MHRASGARDRRAAWPRLHGVEVLEVLEDARRARQGARSHRHRRTGAAAARLPALAAAAAAAPCRRGPRCRGPRCRRRRARPSRSPAQGAQATAQPTARRSAPSRRRSGAVADHTGAPHDDGQPQTSGQAGSQRGCCREWPAAGSASRSGGADSSGEQRAATATHKAVDDMRGHAGFLLFCRLRQSAPPS